MRIVLKIAELITQAALWLLCLVMFGVIIGIPVAVAAFLVKVISA